MPSISRRPQITSRPRWRAPQRRRNGPEGAPLLMVRRITQSDRRPIEVEFFSSSRISSSIPSIPRSDPRDQDSPEGTTTRPLSEKLKTSGPAERRVFYDSNFRFWPFTADTISASLLPPQCTRPYVHILSASHDPRHPPRSSGTHFRLPACAQRVVDHALERIIRLRAYDHVSVYEESWYAGYPARDALVVVFLHAAGEHLACQARSQLPGIQADLTSGGYYLFIGEYS